MPKGAFSISRRPIRVTTIVSARVRSSRHSVSQAARASSAAPPQKAAVAALRGGDAFPKQMVVEFDRRRRLMVERLNKMPGITCRMPAGAFYAFPNVSGLFGRRHEGGTIASAADLASYFLKEARVALVPGEPFGSASHIRLSYATSMEAISRGMDRMDQAIRLLR